MTFILCSKRSKKALVRCFMQNDTSVDFSKELIRVLNTNTNKLPFKGETFDWHNEISRDGEHLIPVLSYI